MKKYLTGFAALSSINLILSKKIGLVSLVYTLFFSLSNLNVAAQPTIEWDKTIGGDSEDYLLSLQQTSDGGYILGGDSRSSASGDKSENSRGRPFDYWIVKLNAAGTKEWDKTIGGNDFDNLASIQQTTDGGYILGGVSASNAGGDKSEDAKGGGDCWVVKLNAAGTIEWEKTIGGNGGDGLKSLQQTSDGGYILGGHSNSNKSGDKSENSKGGTDYWVVKLNAAGGKEWDKTIGGNDGDEFQSLQQTADGGYILGGWTSSEANGDKSENSKGGTDYWVVKLNAVGQKEWDKTIGGSSYDLLSSLQQTADGGYILGGNSSSGANGDKSDNTFGPWIVKLNAAGTIEWDKTIGGNNNATLSSIHQTSDGGYIWGGYSVSNASGDKSEDSKGGNDYWVIKLNAAGPKEWDKTIGGNNDDLLYSLQQTADGGYILGGSSFSNAGGDKSEDSKGVYDYWIVKLNAAGTKEWDKTIGGNSGDIFGNGSDALTSLQQTSDGGYILGGISLSNAYGDKSENSKGGWDYWVVKLSGEAKPCRLTLTTKVTQAEPWYGLWGPLNGAGAIDLTVTGGTAPYTYQWNADVTTQDIPVAAPGHYAVTVTDVNGCTGSTTVYVGQKDDFLRVLSSHTNVSSPGGHDGAIDLTVVGGVVPATYQWSNGATTEDLTGLSAGTYSVVVTDAFGRQATTTVILAEPGTPLSLSIAHQNVSASGHQDGAVDLTVVGGVGPYTYRWNTGATTEDLHYALPGDYRVTVTDANGATATASVRVGVGRTPILLAQKPAGGEDLFASATGVKVYPNPATDQAQVVINLAEAVNYTLDLYDIRGAKVKTIAAGKIKDKKALAIKLPLAHYAKGVYLLKLVTDKGVYSKRLIVDR